VGRVVTANNRSNSINELTTPNLPSIPASIYSRIADVSALDHRTTSLLAVSRR
jgi:hypothetical protein